MNTPTPYLVYEHPLWDASGKFLHDAYWSQPVFFCHANGTVFDSNVDMRREYVNEERNARAVLTLGASWRD